MIQNFILKAFYYYLPIIKMENQEQQEIWRTTDYYPGYTFSNKGRIYSYRSNPNRFLCGGNNGRGYTVVHILDYNNDSKQVFLNRIIYMLFGDEPELLPYREVDHINFEDKSNNNINNLRIATRKQNIANKGKDKINKQGNICSSQFKGVRRNKGKWQSEIVISKRFYLGRYKYEENCAWVFYQVAKHFKDKDFWYNNLGEDFELPDETENRNQVVTDKINKIQNHLDSLT